MVFRRKESSKSANSSGRHNRKGAGEEPSAGVHLRIAATETARAASIAADNARETLAERLQAAKSAANDKMTQKRAIAKKAKKKAQIKTKQKKEAARQDAVDALTPLMSAVMAASEGGKKMLNKAGKNSRKMRKEAKLRAQDVSRAVRGERRRRWPLLFGAFAAGAAVGAMGSLMMRRARELDWQEFDLREQAMAARDRFTNAAGMVRDRASTATGAVRGKASELTGTMKDKANSARKSGQENADPKPTSSKASDSVKDNAGKGTTDLKERASASGNGRSGR